MDTDQQTEQTIIKPGLELVPFDAEAEIKKFPILPRDLLELASRFANLTINGLADKEGYKAVVEARKTLKKKRVEVENIAYDIRERHIKFQKAVITREKDLVAILEPTEKKLLQLEKGWEDLVEADRQEQERQKAARIQSMLAKLSAVEYAIDIFDLQAMNDDQFLELLVKATADFEEIKLARAKDQLAKAEADRLAEAERMAREAELERQRVAQAAAMEEQRVAQEKQRLELEHLQAKVKADTERLAAERQQMEEEQERAKKQRTELRKQRLLAAGFQPTAIGYLYTSPFTKQVVQVLSASVITEADQGWEELFNSAVEDVARKRVEDEEAKLAHDKEQEKLRKQREKEEKREKELRMSDAERFLEIKNNLLHVMTLEMWNMQSKWGKLAADKAAGLVNEAIEICKANETTITEK